jgi:hypothetical protein
MPRTPQRAGWWRFPAPSVLVFTLFMGLFPWIEVGCEGKKGDFDALNQANPLTGKKPASTIGANGTVIVATQNAYQMIWAGSSKGSEIAAREREMRKEGEKLAKQMKDAFKDVKVEVKDKPKKQKAEDEPDAAPLMAVFFFLVIGAITVGFAMPPGLLRTLIFGGTLSAAVLVLVIQAAIGFPLKAKFDEQKDKQAKQFQALGGFGVQQGSGAKQFCRLTMWYYLSWPFLLIPLGLVGTEELIALLTPGGKKKSKRRAAYEEEDEDDRPRKRRRRDEEDDEDERPRARRRSEDEEEEAPRKRRRDPDEDARYTDERPRKKPRVEVEDEEDEVPRKRRRDPHEDARYTDERPRKRARAEDDEEERPRKKARRYEDD